MYKPKETVYFMPAIERLSLSDKLDRILKKYMPSADYQIGGKYMNMLAVYYNSRPVGSPDIFIKPYVQSNNNPFILVDPALFVQVGKYEKIIYSVNRKNVSAINKEIEEVLEMYFER